VIACFFFAAEVVGPNKNKNSIISFSTLSFGRVYILTQTLAVGKKNYPPGNNNNEVSSLSGTGEE
jgi:hypothetical protein